MLMLLYPLEGEIEGYSREQFLDDLCDEVEKDIRQCFDAGAVRVSIDFTEGRLANKNDSRNPWTGRDMLGEFIELNNRVFDRFSPEERRNIGIHTCPGGDMRLRAQQGGAVREAAEPHVRPQRRLLPDPVRQRGRQGEGLPALRAVQPRGRQRRAAGLLHRRHQPARPRRSRRPSRSRTTCWPRPSTSRSSASGATDDCGFSPFSRDEKPKHGSPDFARDVAMQKIEARLEGARMASQELGV